MIKKTKYSNWGLLQTPKKNPDGEFLKNLKDILNKVKNRNKHIAICSDFNYDLLKHEFNANINEFINIMSSSSLQPCITKPTRIVSYNRPSLVDNIFVNTYDKTIFSGNLLDQITDHLANFIIIKNLSLKPQIKKIRIRDMKNFNQEKYIQDIKEMDNLNFHLYKDVNGMLIIFSFFRISLLRLLTAMLHISHCLKNRVSLDINPG